MKKLLKLGLTLLSATTVACSIPQAQVSVKNDCNDAFFKVSKMEINETRVVTEHLMPGDRISVDLVGVSGQANRFVIMADGFKVSDNTPIGTAQQAFDIYPSSGEATAPKNNYAVKISCGASVQLSLSQ